MSDGQNTDDGTREAAVRELGEERGASTRGGSRQGERGPTEPRDLRGHGYPHGIDPRRLGCEPGSPATRPESSGLSVRARGRLDQAVAWSRGRIVYREPATGASGEVSVRIEASPAGPGRTQTSPTAVMVTRHADCTVALQLNNQDRPIPVTDPHVAEALGLELETWVRSRDSIEKALAAIASARPALKPDSTRPHRPEELSTTPPGTSAPGPGIP